MEPSKPSKLISPEEETILSMFHGLWQNRCLSIIVAFGIPDILCNRDKPLSIEDIAAQTNCKSSRQLYPIMRVLAQWGIGEEVRDKCFVKNKTMELLRRDKEASLGHVLFYYGCEEHFISMKYLSKCVKEDTTPFDVEHGMKCFSYVSEISSKPYSKEKQFYGASKYPIGSDERRRELAQCYPYAMECLSNLAILPDKDVNNLYKVYPWTECQKIVDVGGNVGKFLASVLKKPGCENLQGVLVDLPEVIDKATANFPALGLEESRMEFIKQDITQPFPEDLEIGADTVIFMNVIACYIKDIETITKILQNARALFSKSGGNLLIIDNCSPDPGNSDENIGVNGRQLGFHSLHFTCIGGGGFHSKKEWIEILTKLSKDLGYKFIQVHDTFSGGYKIFELRLPDIL